MHFGTDGGRARAYTRGMLVGRERELELLTGALGSERPVLLVGEAGVGKTTLLRAACAERPRLEGGGLQTLSWMPYLPIERAIGRSLPAADAAWVASELSRVAKGKVLIVDDLHWSDPGTRDVLGLVAGRTPLLGAVRTGEEPTSAVVDELLGRGFERVDLGPLDAGSAAELARLLRPDLSETAVARLLRRTGGNPLLIEELVSTDEPSDTLRLALSARLRKLGGEARAAMAVLALAARPLPSSAITGGADDLVDAGLAVRANGDVALRHALLGEVLAEELDPAERKRTHALIARATSDPGLAARHHAEAGECDAARALALRAADATPGPAERAGHLLVAASCADPDESAALRVTAAGILAAAGVIGDLETIVDGIETDDPETRGQIAHARAYGTWARGEREGAIATIDEGLRAVEGLQTQIEISLRILRGQLVAQVREPNEALLRELDAVCEVARERDVLLGHALGTLGWALGSTGQPYADVMLEAIGAARDAGDVLSELKLTANLLALTIWHRRTDEAWVRPTLARALERARAERLGVQENTLRIWEQAINLAEGRYDDVITTLRAMLDEPLQRQWRNNAITSFVPALINTGHLDEALTLLDRELHAPVRITDSLLVGKAQALLWAGRPRDVIEACEACLALDDLDPDVAMAARTLRAHACWELGLEVADAEEAPEGRRSAPLIPEASAIAMLARDEDPIEAAALLDDAAAASGDVAESVRLRWLAGEALRRGGDLEGALERLRGAEEVAERHGMRPLLDRIRRSLRLAGERRSAARTGGGGDELTGREREVLSLVAAGLTNAEIARRLGLSPSTVARQVSSAQTKLGAANRAHAAVLATQA